jgi:dihydrodipicolinate synthase/N-acetylneuraminate lyase
MPFEKGKSGNPAGRPKGTANKTTEELRQVFAQFLEANIERLQELFDELEPKEQLSFIERVAKLVMPPPMHALEKLSDEQIIDIIAKLKKGEL